MKQLNIKQGFVALSLVVFVTMALKIFLEPSQLDVARYTSKENTNYFAEIGVETVRPAKEKETKSSDQSSKEGLSHTEKITVTSEKPLAISKCGYNSCPTGKPGFLNVHLVPHSHDDLGFLNTMDQYYYGEEKIVGVVKVIDTIVEGLKDHPYRKFIFVEIAFFQRWWNTQNETVRNVVKNLVANGQLEFINGGWCMNDEAVTHYVDIIDQMSLGSNFLNETFGKCGRPKIGWQIDTFGHSKENANLMAQMGFDGIFLWRIHQAKLEKRRKSKTMEFIWEGNKNLGDLGKIFTGVLYNNYDPPSFLCLKKDQFDESWVDLFLDYLKDHTQHYRTTDIMVPVGTDFRLREDFTCFLPTDKLIEHTNKLQETGSKVNLFYSTPSCYVKALNSHKNITWPSKTDDFFPYVTYSDEYPDDQENWTGFYTSRPAFKYMIREGSNLLQSCKQMASYLSMKSAEFVGNLTVMKQAMGVMQHHDGVTGTSSSFVTDDYIRILYRGFEECLKIQNSFYQKKLPKVDGSLKTTPSVSYCNLNMSQCDITEQSERVIVNVYNSLASIVNNYVRIPVLNRVYRILDHSGMEIPCDMIPIASFVRELPGRNSSATHELVFLASMLPAMGSKSYYIEVLNISSNSEIQNKTSEKIIENQHIRILLNETTGLINSIYTDGEKVELEQEFFWYAAREPVLKGLKWRVPSGAYIFRPNLPNPFPVRLNEGISVSIYKGKLVQEIHQRYNSWVGQIIRLYMGHDNVELDWVVGPISVEDNVGKEVVNRITTKFSSKNEFYTDANGRQVLKRIRGIHENSLNINITDPVPANYYPINSHISIKDESIGKQLSVLVDRAQGGSSLTDGQLELMVHRRLLHDDFQVGPLDETAYGVGLTVRGTHFLVLSSIAQSAKSIRQLSHQIYKKPQISFIPTEHSFKEWSTSYNMETRILNKALPWNINVLNLDLRSDGKYLLRLEHPYDVGEDTELSKPVMLNLSEILFGGFSIKSVEETMLGGNQFKRDSKRFVWKESGNEAQHTHILETSKAVDIKNITIYPMQIRTFIVTIE